MTSGLQRLIVFSVLSSIFEREFMQRLLFTLACSALAVTGMEVTPVAADRLDDMISPIAHPLVFEDPRINTELRPIFAYHKMQHDFVTQGGNVRYYALEARFAVTDDLAIIATKDGWLDFNPNAVLSDEQGWANMEAGVKYSFFRDSAAGQIVSAGLRYEIPSGNTDVLQGNGDGSMNPFITAGYALGSVNLLGMTGFRFALDDKDSSFYDANLHLDVPIDNVFYPTVEFNLVHVIDAGERLPIADEGFDVFNFGASESDGKTTVVGSVGARVRLMKDLDWGIAYQFPLTTGRGSNVIDWRITTDFIYSFALS